MPICWTANLIYIWLDNKLHGMKDELFVMSSC